MRTDGLLCIVNAAVHLSAPYQLLWHTVDPASGQVLSSENRHFWTIHPDLLDQVFHAASHRVVALPDEQSIVVLEADTLQEINRILVPHGNPRAGAPALSLGSLAWSHEGARLAITCAPAHGDHGHPIRDFHDEFARINRSSALSEVRIYDVTSAQCQQSLVLQGPEAQIFWSSSLDILVVRCRYERIHPDQGADVTLQTMAPAKQQAEPLITEIGLEGHEQDSCSWIPCSSLLLTSLSGIDARACEMAICIQDPYRLRCILEIPGHLSCSRLVWGSKACPGSKGSLLRVYLAEQGFVAKLWREDGEWQARLLHLEGLELSSAGSMTPSGTACVGLTHQNSQLGVMYHYNVDAQQVNIIADGSDGGCYSRGMLPIAWAGFADSWRHIYAYVHSGESVAMHAVRLVDAQAHKVVGSWTSAALKSLGPGSCQCDTQKPDDLAGVFWSPNGKHLAVRCQQSWALIRSF